MMQRDFSALARSAFDLLVIGGGIYGAWIAYDAALRGLRVALVERTDWGAGTSSASSKLIHGGLRYLEHLRLRLVRTSLRERRLLTRLAPHRVRPLRFVIPVRRGARVGRVRWTLGLTLYDWLSGADQPVAPHEALSATTLTRRLPFLGRAGLLGGLSYGDCQMDDARFTLEIVDGAHAAGVAAVNHADVTRLVRNDTRASGAEVHDQIADTTLQVAADVTVDCRGPWGLTPLSHGPSDAAVGRLTKGVHLVMPSLATPHALLLQAPSDGRVLFLIPWHGRTLLGTTDTPYDGDPDATSVSDADIAYLLEGANAYLDKPWSRTDILSSFAGLRMLRNEPDVDPSDITREWSLVEPAPGLLMPIGGKYTTARVDAATVVDRAMELLGRTPGPSPTGDRMFPWTPSGGFEAWLDAVVGRGIALGLDDETAQSAALRFGAHVDALHDSISQQPALADRLHPELPFCRAEVVHAVEAEMACTLEDVLRRRIPLSILARPDDRVVADAAAIAGTGLRWSAHEQRDRAESFVARASEANP